MDAGFDNSATDREDIGDDQDLARQLDFNNTENLPSDDQKKREILSSPEEIELGYSGEDIAKELSVTSQVIDSSCPTLMAACKVRANTLRQDTYRT